MLYMPPDQARAAQPPVGGECGALATSKSYG